MPAANEICPIWADSPAAVSRSLAQKPAPALPSGLRKTSAPALAEAVERLIAAMDALDAPTEDVEPLSPVDDREEDLTDDAPQIAAGFLRTLPLIGGGVTLIGRATAVHVPLQQALAAPDLMGPKERARYAWSAFSAAARELFRPMRTTQRECALNFDTRAVAQPSHGHPAERADDREHPPVRGRSRDPGAVYKDPARRDHYLKMYGNICYDTRDQYVNFPWSSEK